MLRLVAAYRWELLLVVGIPLVAGMVESGALAGITFASIHRVMEDYDAAYMAQVAAALLGTITTGMLLVLFYDRARRQGRPLLALLWGYSLWGAIVGMLTLGIVLLVYTTSLPNEATTGLLLLLSITGAAFLLQLGVLFWFARQASRHSLMHMCFVVVWAVTALGLGSVHPTATDHWRFYAASVASGGVGLAIMMLQVWMLGNFERRGPLFRRNAALALVTTAFVSGYVGVMVGGTDYWAGFYVSMLSLLSLVSIGELQYAPMDTLDSLLTVVALAVNTAFELMALAALLGFAYLLRVRQQQAAQGSG